MVFPLRPYRYACLLYTSANKYVKEIRLFDVYEGGQIPEGKKSMAFTVTFAPKEEAFDFEKVQKFVEKICKKLQNEFNIELRG